ENALIQRVSKMLKLNPQNIDREGELNKYGFDSITLTAFANQLNQKFNLELAPTLFFEYSTIGALADYLAREHSAAFEEQFRTQTIVEITNEVVGDKKKPASGFKGRRSRFVTNGYKESIAQEMEPVAVVGMSGCFPGAENLDQFWRNLIEEKDCISLIPKDRWDWKSLYGDPYKEVNKCNIKWGGFINNLFNFDPLFFDISPGEAQL
ncbi:MAG: hypothetical protein GY786_14940, partial [Proteobacteria bacterium]|nr:hypothetical protein [Pseudomonadota bacterium]